MNFLCGFKKVLEKMLFIIVLVKHGSNQMILLYLLQFRFGLKAEEKGSAMIVSNDIEVDHFDICSHIEESCLNLCICCCFISSKHHRVAVVSVYRSPSTSLKDAINELGCVVSLHTYHIILAGDFNINLLGNSGPVVDYMNLLSDLGLQQHVSDPSCIS